MVTQRLPVGIKRVNWIDGQRVFQEDVRDDQLRHRSIDAATVANFLGSGVVLAEPTSSIILDTNDLNTSQQVLLDSNSFDGQNIYIGSNLTEPSDTLQGVQLSVTLSNVDLDGAETTRIVIIGDTFGGDLIHDDLIFNQNGTQITRGRYTSIRGIIFADFAGNLHGSRSPALSSGSLVGRCIIREASSLEVSYDHVVAQQVAKPSQFFNNFIPADISQTITEMLEDAIGADKSLSDLNIGLGAVSQREIDENDVTTKIGQKFLAKGTNIQKISVLLSVKYDSTVPAADAYNWSGSIALTVHALQTDVQCPVDPVPDNAIDFDPDPAIIGQISLNATDLLNQGVVLDGSAQKVDFVFTNTKLSSPTLTTIVKDRYYVFTISRTGDTSVGTIVLEEAPNTVDSSYMVVFDGSQWINVYDSDMWFSVEGDYIKVTDGLAYENGVGVEVPRIKADSTNTIVPYVEGLIPLYTTSQSSSNFILLEKTDEFSDTEESQTTGDDVATRVKPVPLITAESESAIDTLREAVPAPILLAEVVDTNPRGNPAQLTGTTTLIGLVDGNIFNIINPSADLLSHKLVGSILTPNTSASNKYRIIKTEVITDAYGDLNGDGVIDSDDLAILSGWVVDGYFATALSTSATQQQIIDGYGGIDGYGETTVAILRGDLNGDGVISAADVTLLTNYINNAISTFTVGSTFTRLKLTVEALQDPLTTAANISATDSQFTTVPFTSTSWSIDFYRTWIPDLISVSDLRRYMPTTFTEPSTDSLPEGRNDVFIPGNLLIDGYQLNQDGTPYSVDFEMSHLSLVIPIVDSYGSPTLLDGYTGINLFDNFVVESSDGKTVSGFDAMKYADGTYVQSGDFQLSKVKIVPTLQSIAHKYSDDNVDGYINDITGLYYDPNTSLLTIYADDIYDDGYGNTLPPRSTKISVAVYLKRAGFRNATRNITEAQMRELLNI